MLTYEANENWWQGLYQLVLNKGHLRSPRERPTLEVNDITYVAQPHQHLDATPARKLSLNYIKREFLWYCLGNRFDKRMVKYAPIWESCIDIDGGINSNYGQYLFPRPELYFFRALDRLIEDRDSRRCWLPISQSIHQTITAHRDYTCTTGLGFRIDGDQVVMTVHMRSQDLIHGAGNDEPVCYLLQKLAVAYLNQSLVEPYYRVGPIIHHVASLHLYERHLDQAARSACAIVFDLDREVEMTNFTWFHQDFNSLDLAILFCDERLFGESPMLRNVLLIPGDYGIEDQYWSDR